MDHKLSGSGTKLWFNPLLQVLWAQRLHSILYPGKQSQIIFVKKKKLPGRKFHPMLRKISPEAMQPLSLHSHFPSLPWEGPTRAGSSQLMLKKSDTFSQAFRWAPGEGTCRPLLPACSPPPSERPQSWYKLHSWKVLDSGSGSPSFPVWPWHVTSPLRSHVPHPENSVEATYPLKCCTGVALVYKRKQVTILFNPGEMCEYKG